MSEYTEESADSWRVFRIIAEFVDGFEALQKLGPSVSIFGSVREKEGTENYKICEEIAKKLSAKGFAVITGGGPGIMEAANRGAQSVEGRSCGVGVDLPLEKCHNPFVDPEFALRFRYFFVRKVMFIRYAQACIFMPGGYGTLDELFEVLTLIQTKKIQQFPIFLVGSSYWKGLLDWIEQFTLAHGYIDGTDTKLFQLCDDPDEIARAIEVNYLKKQSTKNF